MFWKKPASESTKVDIIWISVEKPQFKCKYRVKVHRNDLDDFFFCQHKIKGAECAKMTTDYWVWSFVTIILVLTERDGRRAKKNYFSLSLSLATGHFIIACICALETCSWTKFNEMKQQQKRERSHKPNEWKPTKDRKRDKKWKRKKKRAKRIYIASGTLRFIMCVYFVFILLLSVICCFCIVFSTLFRLISISVYPVAEVIFSGKWNDYE